MPASEEVLGEIAALISARQQATGQRWRVAIDGRDGAGKTTFGDRLAVVLRDLGMEVYRASIDDFQQPSAIRYWRGRESAEGYYFDGFDYESVRKLLLDPFAPGGSGRCRLSAFDLHSDRPVDETSIDADSGAILLVDGVFLHRPELIDCWEFSIYLEIDPVIALERGIRRDSERSGDAELERRLYEQRYAPGQALYHEAVHPELCADLVVDNTDVARPVITRR